MDSFTQALALLKNLEQDSSIPKNARAKLSNTLRLLEANKSKVDISKALGDLENLSDDVNMPAHLRTQLFSIVSLLEIV